MSEWMIASAHEMHVEMYEKTEGHDDEKTIIVGVENIEGHDDEKTIIVGVENIDIHDQTSEIHQNGRSQTCLSLRKCLSFRKYQKSKNVKNVKNVKSVKSVKKVVKKCVKKGVKSNAIKVEDIEDDAVKYINAVYQQRIDATNTAFDKIHETAMKHALDYTMSAEYNRQRALSVIMEERCNELLKVRPKITK